MDLKTMTYIVVGLTFLIYIVIAFAPILWVTRAYPGTRNISRRGIEIAMALRKP